MRLEEYFEDSMTESIIVVKSCTSALAVLLIVRMQCRCMPDMKERNAILDRIAKYVDDQFQQAATLAHIEIARRNEDK